jgi:glycosyltransferase involved in cell wall biosynthesis
MPLVKNNNLYHPFVSVLMPTLNQVQFIELSIRSVLLQTYTDLELIVVDGQSTDGTVELLCKLQKEFCSQLRWISQKDSGPAQALNTALSMAQGDLIGWLNSDDLYTSDAVGKAVSHFEKNPYHQLIYGFAKHIDSAGFPLRAYPTKPPSSYIDEFANGSFICQPSVFMRKEALILVGPFNESLQTAFDFELWLRFFKRLPGQIGLVRRVQAFSRLHAACLTQRQRQTVALEGMQVLAEHLKKVPLHWFYTHLDEMCDSYPFGPNTQSLIKQLETFIKGAKPYLVAQDLKVLSDYLRSDYRLILSKPGLMATVQPDGWVSRQVSVKYRWEEKPAAAILVSCAAACPVSGKMRLKVRTPNGDVQSSVIEVPEDFVLRLEVPATEKPGQMMWTIETAQTFVPAKHDKSSKDKRRLSFRVLELKPEE